MALGQGYIEQWSSYDNLVTSSFLIRLGVCASYMKQAILGGEIPLRIPAASLVMALCQHLWKELASERADASAFPRKG